MKKKISYKEALNKAKYICTRQEKSCGDVRKSLAGYELSQENIEKIIDSLIKENYIDDKRYASLFAIDKFKLKKWGKRKIRYALKQKGVSEEIIAGSLDNIDDMEYENTLNTELQKKLVSIHSGNTLKVRGKLFNFAQSRGFESDLTYKVIDLIMSE